MSALRFHSRLALLDLELRRLWREPWLAYASVMLVPLMLTILLGGVGVQSAPGVRIFRALCWWWCLAAHVVFIPLMGLAFWGEEKRDENEALRVAGFSTLALFSGVLGSRLVTALAVLLIPAPLLVLCYLLGGLTASGLLAACLHLPLHFLFLASLYALLGAVIRSPGLYWVLGLVISLLFTSTTLAGGSILAGAPRAVLLAIRPEGVGSRVAMELAGTALAALALLCCSCAALAHRLHVGEGDSGGSRRVSRWLRPRGRPTAADAVRWKERWFGLGGLAGHALRRLWGPVAVLLLLALPYALLAGSGQAQVNLVYGYALLLLLGLIFSLAHGILSAHRLFAMEKQDRTLDDLLLARGSAFGIVHEKLQEYRDSSLQLWYSCLVGMYFSFLIVGMSGNFDVFTAVVFLSFIGAPFAFMFFRMQEGFATALFRTWSRSERMPAVTLLREAAVFVGSTAAYLILVPASVMVGLLTLYLAVVTIPLLVCLWIRHFNRALRQRQRELIRDVCEGCGDLSFEKEMARLYGASPPRKPSVFFPAGPPPPPAGPGAYSP